MVRRSAEDLFDLRGLLVGEAKLSMKWHLASGCVTRLASRNHRHNGSWPPAVHLEFKSEHVRA
jgi:hypothetical protein